MPAGWNKTIADLMREAETGVRGFVASPEVDWAREYERSLIAEDVRIPTEGDVYEAIEQTEVDYLTSWAAPFTGGGKAILPAGTRVIVGAIKPGPKPIRVYAEAEQYRALEELVVPMENRTAEKYSSYYFSVRTVDLHHKFRFVRNNGA